MNLLMSILLVLFQVQDDESQRLEKVGTIQGHKAYVSSVALSSEGNFAASSDMLGTVRVWTTKGGLKQCAEFRAALGEGIEQWVYSLAFSPDGKLLAAACEDKTVWIWDLETKKLLRRQRGHEDKVEQVIFTPNGKRAISTDQRGNCISWNVTSEEPPTKLGIYAKQVCVSPDGKTLCVSDGNHTYLADFSTGKKTQPIGTYCNTFQFSNDGKHVIKGLDSFGTNFVEVWDALTGKQMWATKSHKSHVIGVFFTSHNKRVITVDRIRLHAWDAKNGDELARIELKNNALLTKAALSQDGKLMIVGDRDGGITLINLSPPSEKR